MSIVLSPEVEQQIEDLVRSEGFDSADHLMRTFVTRYRELQSRSNEWLQANRLAIDDLIDEGIAALLQGHSNRYDASSSLKLAGEIKREARTQLNRSSTPT